MSAMNQNWGCNGEAEHILVLETKGQDTEQDHVKWKYLDEWVQAVNQQGGFGRWRWDVAKQPGDVLDVLAKHSTVH